MDAERGNRSLSGAAPGVLRLSGPAFRFIRSAELPECHVSGAGLRFARFQAVRSRPIRLATANGGRIEGVGMRVTLRGNGTVNALILGN